MKLPNQAPPVKRVNRMAEAAAQGGLQPSFSFGGVFDVLKNVAKTALPIAAQIAQGL